MRTYMIRAMKISVITFAILFVSGLIVLFGTSYGHSLRVLAAEIILTSQHRHWAKYTFLSQQELDEILNMSQNPVTRNSAVVAAATPSEEREEKKREPLIITVETIKEKLSDHYFEGKLMTISNPFNVKLVTHEGTQGPDVGEKIYVMAQRHSAIAAVNAGGFEDETGRAGGRNALGIVISDGQIVPTPDVTPDTQTIIAGLTENGKMVTGNYSANELLRMGVHSAAGFMPQLIVNGEKTPMTGNGGWGFGPRSIMAQKQDGTMMFLVIDGRQTHSIGASIKDCQDILYERGAYNALAMDGGSSATLYAMGEILNIPSTLSHQSRYLPNAWIVTPNAGQKVEMTIDGVPVSAKDMASITGLPLPESEFHLR